MFRQKCLRLCCTLLIVLTRSIASDDLSAITTKASKATSKVASTVKFKILDGKKAFKTDFPYVVLLAKKNSSSVKPFCGGTIIDNKWIITARHCVRNLNDLIVILPRTNSIADLISVQNPWNTKRKPANFNYKFEQRNVDVLYIYKKNWRRNNDNDIALLRLEEPIVYDQYLQPIELAEHEPEVNSIVQVCGWGAISIDGRQRDGHLKKLNLQIASDVKCQRYLGFAFAKQNQFCAISKGKRGDTCQGDSGGPVILKGHNSDADILVGITSWGVGNSGYQCGLPAADKNIYGSYASIGDLRHWIDKVLDYTGDDDKFVDDNTQVKKMPVDIIVSIQA